MEDKIEENCLHSNFCCCSGNFNLDINGNTNNRLALVWRSRLPKCVFYPLASRIGLRIIAGIPIFLIIYINLRITRKSLRIEPEIYEDENVVPIRKYVADRFFDARKLNILFVAVSIFLALLFVLLFQQLAYGTAVFAQGIFWHSRTYFQSGCFLLYFYPSIPADVVFFLFTAVLLSIFVAGAAYVLFGSREFLNWRDNQMNRPKAHLSILLAILFLKAIDYLLDGYGLLNKGGGVVYGPGYTDVNVLLLAYRVLAVIAVAAAAAVLINIFLRKFRYVIYTVVSLVIVSILLGNVAPFVVQKIRVEPNELAVEAPYIKNNMELTRKAYNLDQIKLESFEATNLTMDDIKSNPD